MVWGIGESFKERTGLSGKAFVSLAADVALTQMERKKKKAKERAEASQRRLQQEAEAAQKLQEEQKKRAIAQESVRKQKARARRRTIFAGQPLEENIFRRTLGG